MRLLVLRALIVSWYGSSYGLIAPCIVQERTRLAARARLGSQDEGRNRRSARAESAKPKESGVSRRLAAHLPHPHLRYSKRDKAGKYNISASSKKSFLEDKAKKDKKKKPLPELSPKTMSSSENKGSKRSGRNNRHRTTTGRRMAPNPQKIQDSAQEEQQSGRTPKAVFCGYCGTFFPTRSSLFRHLRDDNGCRTQALSHGMPIENPLKGHDRALRRKFGDVLLAGCIILHRLPDSTPNPAAASGGGANNNDNKKQPVISELSEGEADFIAHQYECVLVHNRGGRLGFPKGKIELQDQSVLDAALRETWEEAGLTAHRLHVLPRWVVIEAKRRSGVTRLWVGSNAGNGGSVPEKAEANLNLDPRSQKERPRRDAFYFNEDDEENLIKENDETDTNDDDDDESTDPDLLVVAEDDDDDDEEEEDEEELYSDEGALSSQYAGIDVREITGRHGKRARYFVCSLYNAPLRGKPRRGRTQDTSPTHEPPEVTTSYKLSSVNDGDGDIERVEWVNANVALKLLGYKRKTALRRAIVCYEIYHQDFIQKQPKTQANE